MRHLRDLVSRTASRGAPWIGVLLLAHALVAGCGPAELHVVPCEDGPTCVDETDCVTCEDAPEPACVDDATLRTYALAQACAPAGACEVVATDTACPHGCLGGACAPAEACEDVVCDAPPDACHADAGVCTAGGGCDYAPLACVDPPEPHCDGPTTLVAYDAVGVCTAATGCRYPRSRTTCPFGCDQGWCMADPCGGVVCDTPPGACTMDTGVCFQGTCFYPPDDGATCDDPPEATCLDAHTLLEPDAAGTCGLGVCDHGAHPVDCPFGCGGSPAACAPDPCAAAVCGDPGLDPGLDAMCCPFTCPAGAVRCGDDRCCEVSRATLGAGDGAVAMAIDPTGAPLVGYTYTAPSGSGLTTGVYTATVDAGGQWRASLLGNLQVSGRLGVAASGPGAFGVSYHDAFKDDIRATLIPAPQTRPSTVVDTVGAGKDSAIAFDADGVAHVAYARHLGAQTDLYYARLDPRTEVTWQTSLIERGAYYTGIHPAIAVDAATGVIHVSYQDGAAETLRYARRDAPGGAWQRSTVDAAGLVGNFSALALSPDGDPAISYRISSMPGGIALARWDGAGWEREDLVIGGSLASSLAYDADGVLHVAYQATDGLGYLVETRDGWQQDLVDDTPTAGWSPSITVDATGIVRIAYHVDHPTLAPRQVRVVTLTPIP